MVDLAEGLILFISWLVVISIYLLYPRNEDQNFVRLSMIMIVTFYLVPVTLFETGQDFIYGNRALDHSTGAVAFSVFCLFIFLSGFMSTDMVRSKRKERRQVRTKTDLMQLSVNKNMILYLFLFGFFLNAILSYFGPNSEVLYKIRSGEAEGSHLIAFLKITSNALMLSAFFLCIGAKWRALGFLCIFLILISYLYGSPGRATLLFAITLFFIFLIKLPARLVVLSIPIFMLILFPAIINGKFLIYKFVVLREVPGFFDVFGYSGIDPNSVFQNLAHPFVSLISVDILIDDVGIRYFYDYVQGVLFYGRVIGADFGPSLTYFNTRVFTGRLESIVPTGYIAFGYVQGLYFGVYVAGLVYRITFLMVKRTAIYKIAPSQELYFYFAFLSAGTFYSGEIRTLVLGFALPVAILHLSGKLCAK
ncbi:hypothetical protein K3729_18585 (plasmid) [Rhodobacteraceae bacterium S2214]|nr:hypothetical protein K3729_18585 [Rhodobacteraceae bacterium S2214]